MINLDVLNILDWIVLSILLWSVVSGVWHGFSNELFGLIGLIIAFIVTSLVGRLLDGPMAGLLPNSAVGRMFGRAIIFLACILMINIVTRFMASTLRSVISSPVDHSAGMVFGFIRGALIVLLPFLLVNLYIDPKVYPAWLIEAHSYPYLNGGANVLRKMLPEGEVNDHNRTDFGALKKAEDAAKEQEKNLKDMVPKTEKSDKDKDLTGNSDWKAVIQTLKETFQN